MRDPIVCHSCRNLVAPVRRRAPTSDLENVSPLFDFGWFCPVEKCKVRLDDAVTGQETKSEDVSTAEPTLDEIPEDILPRPAEQAERIPKRSASVRRNESPKNDSEDLFDRITRERSEAAAEERDLLDRLTKVRTRLAKLDRLFAAISDPSDETIAAE